MAQEAKGNIIRNNRIKLRTGLFCGKKQENSAKLSKRKRKSLQRELAEVSDHSKLDWIQYWKMCCRQQCFMGAVRDGKDAWFQDIVKILFNLHN